MEKMTDSRAVEAQVQGGGEVRAKPLEWQEYGPGEWCDRHHGFHITQDDEEPQEGRFTAAWGECDPERFPTLDEAQAWCQEALDRYIREWAITAPPSAPVVEFDGTDGEVLREFIRLCREVKPVGRWPGERVCAAIERSMANERPFRFIDEAEMPPEREPSMKDTDRELSGPRHNTAPPSAPVGVEG